MSHLNSIKQLYRFLYKRLDGLELVFNRDFLEFYQQLSIVNRRFINSREQILDDVFKQRKINF